MTTLLHSASLVDERGVLADGWVLFEGDRIAATGSGLANVETGAPFETLSSTYGSA